MQPSWKDELNALIAVHNDKRIDGKVSSFDTREERAKYLRKFIQDLRDLGFKFEIKNLKEKHIAAICCKYETDQLAASTIQTYISFLRAFCIWIGKPGMIGDIKKYFKNASILERRYAATHDKSWDIPRIDKYKIFAEVERTHPYVHIQLLMEDAFGLRRKESIMIRPYVAEKDGHLFITDGSKGGRSRIIPIDNEYQREVIHKAQSFVKHTSRHLGDPSLSLEQNMKKFSNVMTSFGIKKSGVNSLGITAHGLRSGYAIREMEKLGLVPLIKGGKIGSLPKAQEIEIRLRVSRLLGHNRMEVMAAYAGAFTVRGLDKLTQQKNKALAATLEAIVVGQVCDFCMMEYETPDGQWVDQAVQRRIFLGATEVNGAQYLEVERVEDGKIHTIAVCLIESITEVMQEDFF